MADIRQYRREKQKTASENTEDWHEDYTGRIKLHRAKVRGIIMAAAVAAVIVVVVVCIVRYNSGYGSYSVRSSVALNDNGYARYVSFGGGYVRYSRDGIALYDYDGTRQWDRTYEINNPTTDICGSYMVIADIEGSEIYLFDESGYVTTINTALPILQINVSSQGLVVATLKDSNASNINMYNKDGSKIYNIKTTVDGDGVPVSMAVSNDGKKLVVAYTAIDGQELATSVVFYNFDEVGQNEVERIVGGYDTYGSQLVSEVEFINDDTAVAFGENVISFFRISEYPKLLTDVEIDYTIRKIFYSSKYVGIYYVSDDGEGKANVYDTSGALVMSVNVEEQFDSFDFTDEELLMYGDDACRIVNMKGKTIFDYVFEDGITNLIPLSKSTEFLYHNAKAMQKITLKHGG